MSKWGNWINQPKIYVLLGYPLGRTMSPAMHNAAFSEERMQAVYLPLCVSDEKLSFAVQAMRTFSWTGANVTIPHKSAIMHMLDEIDPMAASIGAVNTVMNFDGRLIGYNTDAYGFMAGLPTRQVNDGPIVVLGAGGAAKAVAYALLDAGAGRVHILNRSLTRASKLCSSLGELFAQNSASAGTYDTEGYRILREAVTIVNCTPVDFPFPQEWCEQGIFDGSDCVYDVRYQDDNNRLLSLAAASGVKWVIDGKEMLLHQAAQAFRIWTGIEAPIETMRGVLY